MEPHELVEDPETDPLLEIEAAELLGELEGIEAQLLSHAVNAAPPPRRHPIATAGFAVGFAITAFAGIAFVLSVPPFESARYTEAALIFGPVLVIYFLFFWAYVRPVEGSEALDSALVRAVRKQQHDLRAAFEGPP